MSDFKSIAKNCTGAKTGQKTINRLFGGWFSECESRNYRLISIARDGGLSLLLPLSLCIHVCVSACVCKRAHCSVWYLHKGLQLRFDVCFVREIHSEFICGWWRCCRAQSHASLMHFCINGFLFFDIDSPQGIFIMVAKHGCTCEPLLLPPPRTHNHQMPFEMMRTQITLIHSHILSSVLQSREINTLEWIQAKDNFIALLIYVQIIMLMIIAVGLSHSVIRCKRQYTMANIVNHRHAHTHNRIG